MTIDYAINEKSSLEQHGIITSLEHTCQDFSEQHLVVHMEFDREKQNLIAQIQD
jgi:hypothetical protein